MSAFIMYVGDNDAAISISGVRDFLTQAKIDDAVVKVTIVDSSDVEVTGIIWPVTMDFVTGTSGLYRALIDKALAIVEGVSYKANITVVATEGDGEWSIDFVAKRRTA